MSSSYPYIVLPKAYNAIKRSLPPIPDIPQIPQEPKKPIEPVESAGEGCMSHLMEFLSIVLGFAAIAVGTEHKNSIGLVLGGFFLIAVGGIAFYIKYSDNSQISRNFPAAKAEYSKELNLYELQLMHYDKERDNYVLRMKEYDEIVRMTKNIDYILEYRILQLKNYFSAIKNEQAYEVKSMIEMLHIHVMRIACRFKKNILLNDSTAIIFDKIIHVEVRVHTPYDFSKKNIYTHSDYVPEQNTEYYKRIIVLFAEEQAILQTNECVNYLKYVIMLYSSIETAISTTPQIKNIRFWNLEVAKKMASMNFISTYFPALNIEKYLKQRKYFDDLIDELNKKESLQNEVEDDLPF